MDWLSKVRDVVKAIGSVIDSALPVGVGGRTAALVFACTVAPVVAGFVPAAAPAVPIVQALCHWLAPATAVAGVARKL